jgi:hypothetical protein
MGPRGAVAQTLRWNVVGRKAGAPGENEAK